ncbi:MAG: leucine-rich repeat domain-containing protein [Leptospira sp.]|nr:leucine-rich repeat domain-containing protein [Leptospira sp.]
MKSSSIFFLTFLSVLGFTNCAKETVSVDSWIDSNRHEKVLNLSKKEIGTLPSKIGELTSVEELTLQYDSLTFIPVEMGRLTSLRILNLFGNPISSLPDSLGDLQNLEVLLLGRTDLTTVPSFLPKLQKLKTLALDETKIELTEADVEILAQIPNLKTLDLTLLRNFKKLPKNISKLSFLNEIFLQKIAFEKSDVARLRDELPKVRVKL